ncbi:ornithine cyclodeaminase family protein [Corynebacterium hylobatis]|uniref:Ornithine cyclodeaminase family protein n=1 Tax=Corynebacterium hylobatis TaxID=1859290 RepID=A0A3S0B4S4_9CORY|nr:ornithine cyclodeaminase family protein [Corynebacterium hylobatis]RSZ63863.1 ornithine cyclodeaminase family protein [Corynebacterium hylobatis]
MTEQVLSPRPPLFLSDTDIAELSDVRAAMEAVRDAYCILEEEGRTPGRIFAQSEQEWMRIMPSVPSSGRLFGAKSIVGSFASGLSVSYLITLFDKETAELVALLDGNRVTGLRTAATTAVGTSTIVPDRSLTVGVIGSGFEARSHLQALSHIARFSSIRVFSPTEANREAFARDFNGLDGASATAVSSAAAASEGADLILCAARSRDEIPIIESRHVGDDATVISIGSTTAGQRELPVDLIERATTIVVDTYDEVVHDSGDMIAAQTEGVDLTSKVITLNDALRGKAPIDTQRGIRIYKSTGSGLQDIVVAEMLVNRARTQGRGVPLATTIVTTRK